MQCIAVFFIGEHLPVHLKQPMPLRLVQGAFGDGNLMTDRAKLFLQDSDEGVLPNAAMEQQAANHGELLREAIHKASTEILKDLPLNKYIEVRGEPDITIRLENIIPDEDPFLTSAAPSVNLIPSIVDAEPGFKNALDIPMGYMPR